MRLVPKPQRSPLVVSPRATLEDLEEVRSVQMKSASRPGFYIQALCHTFHVDDREKLMRLADACVKLGYPEVAEAYRQKVREQLHWRTAI